MLKKIFVNGKLVPVPVPLKTLGEMIRWIEETLVVEGQWITRVTLNSRVMKGLAADRIESPHSLLTEKSRLEVQIDSPLQLAIQALEAIHNLANIIVSSIKTVAVSCWQAKPIERPAEIDTIRSDIDLELDLIQHLSGLMDASTTEMAAIHGTAGVLRQTLTALDMAMSNSDWRASARLLLNRLEPLVRDIVVESETLHLRLLATPQTQFTPTGSGTTAFAGGSDGSRRK